jgi:hypothetical protein
MDRMEVYLEKRVKTLLADGWEHSRIVEQLSALASKKKLEQLIQTFAVK